MKDFNKLKPFEQKDILNGLLLDGLTYAEIEERFGVSAESIARLINDRAVKTYNEAYKDEKEQEQIIHKKTVFGWIKGGLIVSLACFVAVVFIQSFLGGFESQIVTDSLSYITQPLASIVKLGLAVSFIIFALWLFFPILTTFINEKVNTVSLKQTFLDSEPKSKLNFLAVIFLSLCLLVGLVFSSNAQSPARECIVSTANKEVGTLEKGGNNKGERIDLYRSVSIGKTVKNYSDAWCAYFVHYVYVTCNIKPQIKYPPRAANWFQDAKKIIYRRNFKYGVIKPRPQKGDLIGYMFKAGNIGHIEILYDWKPEQGYFLSVGGNTSNTNTVYRDADKNDGVRLKKRDISTAYIIANYID